MTFEPKKFDDIYNAMVQKTQEQLPGVTDFKVGSVIRTMYESFAYEIALLYEQTHQVYLSGFIDTAEATQLEMVVAILGIQRGLPDFAEGIVQFERNIGQEAIDIPINTLVTTEDREKSPKKVYKTIEPKVFPADQTTIAVKVQAIERGEAQVVAAEAITVMPQPILGIKSVINPDATQFQGKRSETDTELRQRAKNTLLASGKASTTSIETALLTLPGVREVKVKERFRKPQPQPGIVDVFVNGIDFTDVAKVQYLNSQIDRVRAAGVFVNLQSAIPVMVDGVFRIELDAAKVPLASDRLAVEATVQATIAKHLSELGMESPLLFAQMQRQVLSIEGVTNLEEFALAIQRPDNSPQRFLPQHRRIDLQEAEKFQPRHLWVTSETEVSLPVRIQFQADLLDRDRKQRIAAALTTYFQGANVGKRVLKSAIQAQITPISPIVGDTLKLSIESRSPLTIMTTEEIRVGLVERATLDENIFAYSTILGLIGAIRFTPTSNASAQEQESMQETIRDRVTNYLDRLNPEEDIDLEILAKMAGQEGDHFTIEPLQAKDFRVLRGETEEIRLNKTKINVQEFEKAQLAHLCIASEPQPVTLTLTLTLDLNVPRNFLSTFNLSQAAEAAIDQGQTIARQLDVNITADTEAVPAPPASDDSGAALQTIKTRLQTAIDRTLKAQVENLEPGQNLSYESLQQSVLTVATSSEIQRILSGITYSFTQFDLTATSVNDQRSQTRSLNQPQDIHVRSLEKITGITLSPIIFTP